MVIGVAATRRGAIGVTAVAALEIAVVAELRRLGDAVAAGGDLVGADVDARAVDARAAIEVGLAHARHERRVTGIDGARRGRQMEIEGGADRVDEHGSNEPLLASWPVASR